MSPVLDFRDGLLYATPDALALHFHIPVGTIRRWAADAKWPTRKIHGRRYYLISSVEATARQHGRDTRH